MDSSSLSSTKITEIPASAIDQFCAIIRVAGGVAEAVPFSDDGMCDVLVTLPCSMAEFDGNVNAALALAEHTQSREAARHAEALEMNAEYDALLARSIDAETFGARECGNCECPLTTDEQQHGLCADCKQIIDGDTVAGDDAAMQEMALEAIREMRDDDAPAIEHGECDTCGAEIEQSMWRCAKCDAMAALEIAEPLCQQCGAKLASAKEHCDACEQKLARSLPFCHRCGNNTVSFEGIDELLCAQCFALEHGEDVPCNDCGEPCDVNEHGDIVCKNPRCFLCGS